MAGSVFGEHVRRSFNVYEDEIRVKRSQSESKPTGIKCRTSERTDDAFGNSSTA